MVRQRTTAQTARMQTTAVRYRMQIGQNVFVTSLPFLIRERAWRDCLVGLLRMCMCPEGGRLRRRIWLHVSHINVKTNTGIV